MATKYFLVTFPLFVLLNLTSLGQGVSRGSCNNEAGKKISFSHTHLNKVYAEHSERFDSIYINVINTTSDTVYLFKSYFDSALYGSKYIHWVDKKEKKYTISFVPIISTLSTKRSDKIILGENKINARGQIMYEFVELAPDTYYGFCIPLDLLFKNKSLNQNAVVSQSYHAQSKFNQIKFKLVTTKDLKRMYNLTIVFGIYKKISFICDSDNYYKKEFEFNKNAQAFDVVELPITLKGNKTSFLK